MAQTEMWLCVQGALGEYTDQNQDKDAIRNLIGEALSEILGASSALPSPNSGGIVPVTVVPGSGLQVVCGGTGQGVLCQGRVVDNCPTTDLTVPPNSTGSTRYDLVSIQYVQTPVNVVNRPIKNPSTGTVTSGPMGQVLESISFTYTTGTTSLPATPSGQVALAQVAVPNGASSISSGNITYLLPSVPYLLSQLLQSYFSQVVHGMCFTTASFVIQAPSGSGGSTQTIDVTDGTAFPVPVRALIGDGFNLIVVAITTNASNVLHATTEQIISGSAGNTMASGAFVTFAGVTESLPIGTVKRAYMRLPASPQSTTQQLQIQLPTQGTWQLYAEADGYFGGGKMTLSISGATSSESGVGTNTAPPVTTGGWGRADCSGQSQGGQLVTASLVFNAAFWQYGPGNIPAAGTFRFTAVRIA